MKCEFSLVPSGNHTVESVDSDHCPKAGRQNAVRGKGSRRQTESKASHLGACAWIRGSYELCSRTGMQPFKLEALLCCLGLQLALFGHSLSLNPMPLSREAF